MNNHLIKNISLSAVLGLAIGVTGGLHIGQKEIERDAEIKELQWVHYQEVASQATQDDPDSLHNDRIERVQLWVGELEGMLETPEREKFAAGVLAALNDDKLTQSEYDDLKAHRNNLQDKTSMLVLREMSRHYSKAKTLMSQKEQ